MVVRDELLRLLDQVPEEDLPAALDALQRYQPAGAESVDVFSDISDAPNLAALAARQQVAPITSTSSLRGDFWPEDEAVDDLITAVRAWRHDRE